MSTFNTLQTREEQTAHQALRHLVQVGEAFIQGAGCRVEVDLDYCHDLAELEQAVEAGRRAMRKRS
jgi:hypothetical protein